MKMKIDLPVLGLAGCHGQKWKRLSRYVDWASPIHITVQQMRLRWMETSEAHSIPLHIWNENQVGTTTNAQSKHKEVLHLCRWSTHTPINCLGMSSVHFYGRLHLPRDPIGGGNEALSCRCSAMSEWSSERGGSHEEGPWNPRNRGFIWSNMI
jgi:hypothetical protein